MEKAKGRPVSFEEAAADWYDNVYRPAVTLIRKYGILEHYPDRTEGDLYVWMVDHLREVREELGDNADARSFSDALVDFLQERRIPIPKELLVEDDPSVILSRTQVMRAIQLRKDQERANQQDEDDTAE
jgi:hypothetical protein